MSQQEEQTTVELIDKYDIDKRRLWLRNVISYIICWSHYNYDSIIPEQMSDLILEHICGEYRHFNKE